MTALTRTTSVFYSLLPLCKSRYERLDVRWKTQFEHLTVVTGRRDPVRTNPKSLQPDKYPKNLETHTSNYQSKTSATAGPIGSNLCFWCVRDVERKRYSARHSTKVGNHSSKFDGCHQDKRRGWTNRQQLQPNTCSKNTRINRKHLKSMGRPITTLHGTVGH
jgi:hypothetical protein